MRWWRNLRARMKGRVRPAYWRLVEPYFDRVSVYDGPEVFLRDLAPVPAPARNLLAAHWAQSEIHNGGLAQFFFNRTGVLAPEAIVGFESIGMIEAANILREALRVFPEPYPRRWEERRQLFDLPDDPDARVVFMQFADLTSGAFEQLNERFWRLMRDESKGFLVCADRYASGASRGA